MDKQQDPTVYHRELSSISVMEKKNPSVQFSRSLVSDSLWPHGLRHAVSMTGLPQSINSWSLLRLMFITLVLPSNHFLYCPLLPPSVFPNIRVFFSESVLRIDGQGIGVSTSASALPMNIQDWFPLGLTGRISLQSKGLSRVFSNATVQKNP